MKSENFFDSFKFKQTIFLNSGFLKFLPILETWFLLHKEYFRSSQYHRINNEESLKIKVGTIAIGLR